MSRPTFPCPNCSAEMVYKPGSDSLICQYCGTEKGIPAAIGTVEEQLFDRFVGVSVSAPALVSTGAQEVRCERCGAVVEFTPPDVAGECAFCGSQIVAQPKAADPTVAPNGVLPFGIAGDEAATAVKQWLASRWFAPNALKRLARQETASGVYLPYWTYDTSTTSDYEGQRGEHYYETETYTTQNAQGQSVTQTRQVQKTRWYPASGRVAREFDDVLVTATSTVSAKFLAKLEPWDLARVRAYEPAYLSGFKAQRYQVQLDDGFESAKQIMAGVIDGDVRTDIGGDEQRVSSIDTSYANTTFKHLLLPIYLAAYQFNKKAYQVMVNAQTGEVTGDRPYSWVKIALMVLLVMAVFALAYAVFASR